LLVDALLDGHFEVLVSPTLIAELTDVPEREKFAAQAADGRAAAFIAVVLDRAEMVEDAAPASLKTADAGDDDLIALAQAHNADAVVSGDGHLLEVTLLPAPVVPAVGACLSRVARRLALAGTGSSRLSMVLAE
jgi:uncharacterized protein